MAPDSIEPFMRAWFVLQKEASDYEDAEGQWYHYPESIPNARRIEPGDALVFYRPAIEPGFRDGLRGGSRGECGRG